MVILTVRFSDVVCNLGVQLDSNLSFSAQVHKTVTSAFLTIKSVSRISTFLTMKEKAILICSLVLSKLDYANSLYYGIHSNLLNKLQYVQNCAARLVYKRRKYDHVTDLMRDLHWLRMKNRIYYKILLTIHKCIYGESPHELNKLLLIESSRTLNLRINAYKTTYGNRAFSVYAGKHWNELPLYLKFESDTAVFKKLLKTYLFDKQL